MLPSGVKLASGLAAILLFLAGAGARAQAPSPAPLSGTIQTAQGIPIPSATVRVVDLGNQHAWMTWTDSAGKFTFPSLPPGQYRVEAAMLGFSPASRDANVTATGSTLNLSLQVLTVAELNAGAQPARSATSASASGAPGPRAPGRQPARGPEGTTRAAGGRGQFGGRGEFPGGAMSAGAEAASAGMNGMGDESGLGGFQQVDVTGGTESDSTLGQGQTTGEVGGGASSAAQGMGAVSNQSLGAAASSDAFLMNGSVGQGVNTLPGAGMMVGRGGFGGPGGFEGGPGGGFGGPGGGGGRPGGMMAGGGPGGFRGRGPGGPRGLGGPGGQQAGSVASLYARQRFMRRQVNRLRFNLMDGYTNSVWDARPYALNGTSKPQISSYNETFNGSIMGPLIIPHVLDLGSSTFLFANYRYGHSVSAVDDFSTVPTLEERSGNFCDRNVSLYNPFSSTSGARAALDPNNANDPNSCQIPSSLMTSPASLAAQGLLKYMPEPNLAGFVNNFQFRTTNPSTDNGASIRVMHSLSSRFSMSAGYNLMASSGISLTAYPAIAGNSHTRNQNVSLAFVQSWSPHLVNVDSLNFNRSRMQSLSDNSYVNNVAAALGITGVDTTDAINYGIPNIGFTNFGGLNDPIPSLTRNQTWRFDDSVTYSLTKHNWSFGGEVRRIDWNTNSDRYPRGVFTFNGSMTQQLTSAGAPVAGTGIDFADFLLGLPAATQVNYGNAAHYFRGWGYAAYAQDDWHALTRFTLEYGVRYDYVAPPIELYNTIANLAVTPDFSQAVLVLPGQAGFPRSLVHGHPNDWSPRLGFAWQPFHQDPLIVRGGYSIFYNESIYQQLDYQMANQPPFASLQSFLTSPENILTLTNGFPAALQVANPNTYAVDPNYRPGYAQIWDLAVERQLKGGLMIDVYYTGTKGNHLDLELAPHSLPPGSTAPASATTSYLYDTSGASSMYHALHVMVRKRPSRGLMVTGDYTFGKSIDDASTFSSGGGTVVQNDADIAAEYGLSNFDVRQQFRGFSFYQLPFGPRQRWARGGWTERLFGNFRLNGIATYSTGRPFTAQVAGATTNNTAVGANFSLRADQIASGCGGPGTPQEFFPAAAFAVPAAGVYGNAARNTICGPGTFSINMGLNRSFVFGSDQQRSMDLRWEVTNLTNHPNWAGLGTAVNSATFGRVTSVGGMRSMNLNVRFSF